jgi:hypothetical protein
VLVHGLSGTGLPVYHTILLSCIRSYASLSRRMAYVKG